MPRQNIMRQKKSEKIPLNLFVVAVYYRAWGLPLSVKHLWKYGTNCLFKDCKVFTQSTHNFYFSWIGERSADWAPYPCTVSMSCMVGDSTCLLTEKTHLPSLICTSHTASLSGQGKCISPRIKGLNWRIHSKKENQETEAGSTEAGLQRVRGTYYWIRMAWFYGHLGLRAYGLCCRLKTKGARCTEIWKQILIWSHYIQIFTVCTLLMVGTMATVDLAKLLVSRQQKCLALRSPGKLVILLLSLPW